MKDYVSLDEWYHTMVLEGFDKSVISKYKDAIYKFDDRLYVDIDKFNQLQQKDSNIIDVAHLLEVVEVCVQDSSLMQPVSDLLNTIWR